MIIGVPKEIKNNENRVALTPSGAKELTREMMDGLIRSIHVFEDGRIETVWNASEGVGNMMQAPFGKGEAR